MIHPPTEADRARRAERDYTSLNEACQRNPVAAYCESMQSYIRLYVAERAAREAAEERIDDLNYQSGERNEELAKAELALAESKAGVAVIRDIIAKALKVYGLGSWHDAGCAGLLDTQGMPEQCNCDKGEIGRELVKIVYGPRCKVAVPTKGEPNAS